MGNHPDSLDKQREIVFCSLHPNQDQAGTAAQLLGNCEGIDRAERLSASQLRIHYRIDRTCLAAIEVLLEDRGLHLDNSLINRMRRALAHYVEETQRSNLGPDHSDANCTTKVFASRYGQREHGCQDHRPEHWRRYL